MRFSFVPLLLDEEGVPRQVKEALLEDRLQDAADILMQELGLNCTETSDLLDMPAC